MPSPFDRKAKKKNPAAVAGAGRITSVWRNV
jgi:hypothetical protein